jgi:hypothetical protein
MSTKSVTFARKFTNKMLAMPQKSINSFQKVLLNIPVPKPRAQGKDIWSGW